MPSPHPFFALSSVCRLAEHGIDVLRATDLATSSTRILQLFDGPHVGLQVGCKTWRGLLEGAGG
jgi:hypothetical protein